MDIIKLEEEVQKEKIMWLLKQEKIHKYKDNEIKQQLKTMLNILKNDKRLEITYKTSKEFKDKDYGRIYGYNSKGYGNLGSLPRIIRGYLACDDYIDIDIKRCHWYIIKYLIEKNGNFNDKLINEFLEKYNDIIKKISELKIFTNKQYSEYHTDIDKSKDIIFSILNSQLSYLNKEKLEVLKECEILSKLHKQIYKVLLPSLKEENKELVDILVKRFDKDESNKEGKILSHILQNIERKLIIDLIKYFNENDYTISTIIHDGFLMYKNDNFSNEFLRDAEEYIKKNWEGLEIKLVIKEFIKIELEEIPDDILEEEDKLNTPYLKLCNKLLEYARKNNLKKDENGRIYKRSEKNHKHYIPYYDEYNDDKAISKLIEEVYKGDKLFNCNPSNFQNMINFIKNRSLKEFKNIEYDLDLIGFNNCILNLRTLEIINNFEEESSEDKCVRHFIDSKLDINNLNTKKYDEITMYQLEDEEALRWDYIAIGRLFFRPDNDSLQTTLLVYGHNDTGKSMKAKIIAAMFRPDAIGTIQANQEQVFGMESFITKEIIIAFDMPERMSSIISVDLFKGMSSGEHINIPQKNRKAITMKWGIPSLLCSNYYPDYPDKGGALSKRYMIEEYTNTVKNKDSTLLDYIIKNELPSIIYKACKTYKEVLDNGLNKTFNDIKPEYFQRTSEEYTRSSNILYQFLTQPDSTDNEGVIYKIEFNEIYETMMSEIQNRFKYWCKYNNYKNNKISTDDSTFTQMGLKRIVYNICKSCNKEHKKGCCENYSRSNKTTKVIIKGIRFWKE